MLLVFNQLPLNPIFLGSIKKYITLFKSHRPYHIYLYSKYIKLMKYVIITIVETYKTIIILISVDA